MKWTKTTLIQANKFTVLCMLGLHADSYYGDVNMVFKHIQVIVHHLIYNAYCLYKSCVHDYHIRIAT